MLSGGQKQRLSIARALLLDAEILILDDALSAVDGRTEHDILHNLRLWGKGRTLIISAHRLSVAQIAEPGGQPALDRRRGRGDRSGAGQLLYR